MYAKKSLGQHFLKSERALAKIIEVGEVSSTDTVLEIGPGQGALTEKLLATNCKVVAIEKDDKLYESLKQKFEKEISSGQLLLVHDDILKFIENSPPAGPGRAGKLKIENYKLIANIPYNITGAILEKFLSSSHQPERMVLLVQKEVAERVVAKRSKPFDSAQGKESILSLSVKAYGSPHYIERVLAGSFAPAPQVDSAILLIDQISKKFFENIDENQFFTLVRTGFRSKRKKLASNLATIYPKEGVETAYQTLNLDENVRAEDVNIENWHKLAVLLR